MGKTVCIILNYNDAATAIGLAAGAGGEAGRSTRFWWWTTTPRTAPGRSCPRSQRLRASAGRPGISLASDQGENGGYGAGNQAGIQCGGGALWNPEYVMIANPDIHVTDRLHPPGEGRPWPGTECGAVGFRHGALPRRGSGCSPTGICCPSGGTCWTRGPADQAAF